MSETVVKNSILIVDDIPDNLRLLSNMLINQGYKVRMAKSGKMALMGINAVKPDLILLDIKMSGLSGFDVCEKLKSDPATKDIPVIFISAQDQTEDKLKAFQLGGVDYITKPFHIEEVLARITTHLTIRNLQQEIQENNNKLENTNRELEEKNAELQIAIDNIKTLRGLIPICASCKKIRDDEGFWKSVEIYIEEHTKAEFTHGICPECMHKLYPEYDEMKNE